MSNTVQNKTAENAAASPAEIKKNIDAHKKAANHLEEAAKHHVEAAKHHEAGNHDKAEKSASEAKEHHKLASEVIKSDKPVEKTSEAKK